MNTHGDNVRLISQRVKRFYETKQPFSMYHGSTNSTRASNKTLANTVDISHLNNVLLVDTEKRVALVEPNVPMDALVDATLAHGLVPPVVMEFPGITAGGGFAGTSGESSSYRCGFFERTVNWIEIVLGNGEVVHASSESRSDLFYGAASSFGTLGITTLLELQLIEVPLNPVVELTYFPITEGATEAVAKIEELSADPQYQYIDGILFSKEKGVICAGWLAAGNKTPYPVQTFSKATDPWFYMHVEKRTDFSGKSPCTEAIPLVDYYFRYDRGGFWVGKYALQYLLLPPIKLVRWVMDSFTHTRVMYHAVHKSGLFREYTIQDVAVPYPRAKDLMDFVDSSFGRYPIWLCPVRQVIGDGSGLVGRRWSKMDSKQGPPEMVLNFGIWGPGPRGKEQFISFNRRLEDLVHELGGQKWLYARTYYSEEEFWKIYDKSSFDELREKYHASHLPNLYDKVKPMLEDRAGAKTPRQSLMERIWQQWPIGGLYGLIHTLWNRDYLLK